MSPEISKCNFDQSLEIEILQLYLPGDNWIPLENCIPEHLYFGRCRSITELAINTEVQRPYEHFEFMGLKESNGILKLFGEKHVDVQGEGTFAPYVDLGELPPLHTTDKTIKWLLDQLIEMEKLRIDWLNNMPSRLKISQQFPSMLTASMKCLDELITSQKLNERPKLSRV